MEAPSGAQSCSTLLCATCRGGAPWPPLVAGRPFARRAATEDRPYRSISASHDRTNSSRQDLLDALQLLPREADILNRAHRVVDMPEPAGADQCGRDLWMPEHPGQCHLRKSLAASPGDLPEPAHLDDFVIGNLFGPKKPVRLRRSRIRRDAVQVLVGQQTLRQRGEDYAADSFFVQNA